MRRSRGKEVVVICASFSKLTSNESSAHIWLGTVTLVSHDPTATHTDVVRDSTHARKGVDLPDMLIEAVKFVNHRVRNEVVLEYLTGIRRHTFAFNRSYFMFRYPLLVFLILDFLTASCRSTTSGSLICLAPKAFNVSANSLYSSASFTPATLVSWMSLRIARMSGSG